MAERQGATVKEVTAETGSNFTLAELEAAVKVRERDNFLVEYTPLPSLLFWSKLEIRGPVAFVYLFIT